MAFKFGWENYATGFSDFEIHRAQQKHYDAFTGVMVETGPGTWSLPSSSGSGSGSSGSSGSSSDGGVTVHNPGRVTKGPAAGVELSNGKFTFRESKLIDKTDVDGSFDNMELTQVMHPEVTSIKMGGLTWEGNPDWSDAEHAETMYADVGSNFYGILKLVAGDIPYNVGRAWNWAAGEADRVFEAGAPYFNTQSTVVGADGQVYRTGGGF